MAKTKSKSIPKWEFDVILWDSKRTKILSKKTISVRRKDRFVAKAYLRKKYPYPYIVELL